MNSSAFAAFSSAISHYINVLNDNNNNNNNNNNHFIASEELFSFFHICKTAETGNSSEATTKLGGTYKVYLSEQALAYRPLLETRPTENYMMTH